MNRFKAVLIFGSLTVVFLVGITASELATFFGWIDDRCRDWFESIYHGK